ncbi:MAG: acyl-CoA dehydrogenase family protein, partial [Firmicutes bacterium]|nr:acyl-CoA dehydrogenase family protein [Bacillota bacterium]
MRILTEEQKKICKVIDDFCLKEIIPYVGKWDEENYIPTEVYAKAFPLGLNTFEIPKE